MKRLFASLPLIALLALPPVAAAQNPVPAAPMAVPIIQTVPDPVDTPWPGGTITLDIDASDNARGLYRVTQTIPLAPGTRGITLLFPEWLPGNHGPSGPLAELVDLRFTANGRAAAWRRDPVEVNAFHVDLPEGADTLVATFMHTSPLRTSEGRITMTPEMLNLQWEKMSLYPAGHYVRRIRIRPSVIFPAGWSAATSLPGKAVLPGGKVSWAETDYETLVDSPIFAGVHFRRWDLGNNVGMSVVADEPQHLAAEPANIARISAMVEEGLLVFGRPPYDRYEFLVALSDKIGGIGLEHLHSSENQLDPKNFINWQALDWDRNVLAHEFVHSWNGKFRRPAKMWTPDYRQPMQDNLLWLYEGQTQFWGNVIAARSGLQAREIVLGAFATQAGRFSELPGRSWRSVEDTTFDPIFSARKPKPFASLARDEDYYNEGALIWLEVDQIIRAGTAGRQGIDDFARLFFSHPGGGQRQVTYEFEDIVSALNRVYPHDWAAFLQSRFQTPGQPAPLAGFERAGYRLVWREEPNPFEKSVMESSRNLSLTHSLGMTLDKDGSVIATLFGGPAFRAGVVNGTRIVAVNGTVYDADLLKRAITAAKGTAAPIELLVRRGDSFQTVAIQWNGGLRWAWLERDPALRGPAGLDRLLAPRRPGAKP